MKLDLTALRAVSRERELDLEVLLTGVEEALLAAYGRTRGVDPEEPVDARVSVDRETGDVVVLAREREPDGSVIGEYDDTPEGFGRVAAATARRVVTERLREAESARWHAEYRGREGDLVTGIVQQNAREHGGPRSPYAPRVVRVDLGGLEAQLPPTEQMPGEEYRHGSRLRCLVVRVQPGARGPVVTVSRTHPDLVRALFALEVPEVADGSVQIVGVAREAGRRSKVAVRSTVRGLNPKGACIGPRGSRVQAVRDALGGEEIDLVDHREDGPAYVASALAPARVLSVEVVDPDARACRVVVPDYQLSLAIGREGQNARLAARLTGWRIDIRGDDTGDDRAGGDSAGDREQSRAAGPGEVRAR